jgi:hypothetical protein
VIPIPFVGPVGTVLLAPIEELVENFRDRWAGVWGHFGDNGSWFGCRQQGVNRRAHFGRDHPLTASLFRGRFVGRQLEQFLPLTVQDRVPAVTLGPVSGGRFSGHEGLRKRPCGLATARPESLTPTSICGGCPHALPGLPTSEIVFRKSLSCKRGRRDSNPQPPDRQSGTLTN